MRALAAVTIAVTAQVAAADPASDHARPQDLWAIDAPFTFGVAGRFGETPMELAGTQTHATARELGMTGGPTFGAHFGVSYRHRELYAAVSGEWTLILGEGQLPQGGLTIGAALPTTGAIAVYAGPSLRLYDLSTSQRGESWSSGPRFALTGEVGVRALLWRSHARRHPSTAGFYLRANAPVEGGGGWTATVSAAVSPWIRLD